MSTSSFIKSFLDKNLDSVFNFVTPAIVFLIVGWLAVFFIFILSGLNVYEISEWGQAGDTFNIFTSFSSVCTVILLFIAVALQREELKQVKEELSVSRDTLGIQLEEAKKTSRTEVTLSLLNEWQSSYETMVDIEYVTGEDNLKKFMYSPRTIFVKKLMILEEHEEMKSKIDFSILKSIIKNELFGSHLNKAINNYESEQGVNKSMKDTNLQILNKMWGFLGLGVRPI